MKEKRGRGGERSRRQQRSEGKADKRKGKKVGEGKGEERRGRERRGKGREERRDERRGTDILKDLSLVTCFLQISHLLVLPEPPKIALLAKNQAFNAKPPIFTEWLHFICKP